MNRFLIRTKLTFVVALALSALGLVGAAGWIGITRVGSTLETVSGRMLSVSTLMGIRTGQLIALEETTNALGLDLMSFSGFRNAQDAISEVNSYFGSELKAKHVGDATAQEYLDAYKKLPKTSTEAEEWNAFQAEWEVYSDVSRTIDERIRDLSNTKDWDRVPGQMAVLRKERDTLLAAQHRIAERLDKMIEINNRSSVESRELGNSTISTAISVMFAIFIAAVAALACAGWLVVNNVVGSLDSMRKAIVRVAKESDFTGRIEVKGQDELAQTSFAFNGLVESMQEALTAVLSNANKVANAARKSREAAERVSMYSNAQHESAASMAAAIEEMTASINQISESGHEARTCACDTGIASNHGAEIISRNAGEIDLIVQIVKRAADAMAEVGRQSDQISTIIQVIRDVADQTNLLALNAAIEAARAGEQGRGFAVVADEVRKLAERTTQSATEITDMIVAMQNKARSAIEQVESVEAGIAGGKVLSAQATERMSVIHGHTDRVIAAVDGISVALAEQSTTANGIAHQVETVARMIEENRAAASETVFIAAELDGLSEILRIGAEQFRV